MIASSMYLRVQKECSRTPSQCRPARRSMPGPTAAMVTGISGRPVGFGENTGVIRVKR